MNNDDVAEQTPFEDELVAVNGEEQERGIESFDDSVDSAVDDLKHSIDHRDSSSGKLFVGGVSWETTEETFTNYFSKYGEITDSVIMMDKHSGRPRGFGFVTFADSAVADKVLEEDHVIDGRAVEVKRTVPKEDMHVKGVSKTKKIFVGGIPPSLTEDELKEYFSVYGSIVEQQIMVDHSTGRSRGFGFVTFESEDTVDRIFSEGKTHELGGKEVEIKKAEPKRAGSDYSGSATKSYGGFSHGGGRYGGGYHSRGRGYGGKAGRGGYGGGYGNGYDGGYGNGYGGGYGNGYGGYGGYGESYGVGAAAGLYGGYGYGFGYSGSMYGNAGYGAAAGGYDAAAGGYDAAAGGYGSASGYGTGGNGRGRGGGYGSGKGYGSGGAMAGRYHPYQR